MTILEKIEKQYVNFTKKEKQIALYILQHPNEIKTSTIIDLAFKIGTSPALITHFCKKLDNMSFMDLKLGISSIREKESKVQSNLVADHISEFYYHVIERTKRDLTVEIIDSVLEKIKKARRIYIFGVGSSGLSALELQQRLMRMGMNSTCVTDSHMMLINSSIITKEDLVIGISISGETIDIIKALRLAKNRGVSIIGLTAFSESELAKLSDIYLLAYNSTFVDTERFVNSQFALMYVIDILSMKLLEDSRYQYTMLQTTETILSRSEKEN
ncbi:MurR/RpiR family transcriptional regulator [Granulicatella elegans]|jgi:rpiR family phosphosugar-binding transcriptional regulator|uniref:MurR/RpiR family transcriptional regulator n=1 Tax=Granulicatella elegans TaxID=137732 RepID=UPI003C7638CF